MAYEGELFDISKKTWQSFSSEQLIKVESDFESIQQLSLQWFYCHLSDHQLLLLGVERIAGFQLAADMLGESVDSISFEDEQDAVEELVNCISGQLDRDHPANECFGLPKALASEDVSTMLMGFHKLSDVAARVGSTLFYIALFKEKETDSHGRVK